MWVIKRQNGEAHRSCNWTNPGNEQSWIECPPRPPAAVACIIQVTRGKRLIFSPTYRYLTWASTAIAWVTSMMHPI
ncbi:hypothetical protein Y032_0099g3176 [Ancylostoma ceylanicum]|uniref:Uncharacterized protein n=1 Tax=Ancylostoma ceylanicum TaxID=53326 RepID=A0A016TIR3_9BILA|nr:hypothetical protein Y032_0099g3176 [Ancylostoma ceylanicum]